MIAMMDFDKSGKLSIDEFGQLWAYIKKWKVRMLISLIKNDQTKILCCYGLQEIFVRYDRDLSGRLNANELRQALAAAGYNVSDNVLRSLVLRYGDHRRQISFDDFVLCAVKMKAMIGKLSSHVFLETSAYAR